MCNDCIVSILDILMIFEGDGIAFDIFKQSSFGKIELWIVRMFPDKQSFGCVECVCDASAVDEDSYASGCWERFVRAVFDEMAG